VIGIFCYTSRQPLKTRNDQLLLKLTHQTDLTYSDLISESVMELRVAPRQDMDQHRLSFDLAIGPPTSVTSYFDWLGNTVHAFTVTPFHREIRIVATSVVETDRPRKEPERFKDTWPIAPGTTGMGYEVYDYLQFGGPVVESPELSELVNLLAPQHGGSMGEIALRMLHLTDDKFQYRQGITNAASPITEVLKHRAGVCQDFTHLMIGLARSLGIPARYVSGLVHPDAQRFRGYSQTHAWCELLFPLAGWVGFDPTNRCIVSGNFVKVAYGRDYRDVPPNKGIYRGKAEESINVRVSSEELPAIPPELAAERIRSLQVTTYAAGYAEHAQRLAQQQEHQQQQQSL
jgi:transglutaminase-like putative cysteine protease